MGIPGTEYVLIDILNSAISIIKNNLDIIDDIFVDVSDDKIQEIKDWISDEDTEIKTSINYPIDWQSTPTFVILLDREDESDIVIGSSESEPGLNRDTLIDVTDEVIYNSAPNNTDTLYLEHFPVLPDTFLLTIDGNLVPETEFVLHSIQGKIVLNTPLTGGENVKATYQYFPFYESSGDSYFQSIYRIECWAANGEPVLWLFNIAKYWLLLKRTELANTYGLITQQLSASDLQPITDFYPQRVFRRQLILVTKHRNSWLNRYEILENIYVNHADGTTSILRPGN